jgi:hypothetical protein
MVVSDVATLKKKLGFESTCNEKELGQRVAAHCPGSKAYTRQPDKIKIYRLHEKKNSYLESCALKPGQAPPFLLGKLLPKP